MFLWPTASGETSFSNTHALGFLLTLAVLLFCKAPESTDELELEVSLLLSHIHIQHTPLSRRMDVPASDAASVVPIRLIYSSAQRSLTPTISPAF